MEDTKEFFRQCAKPLLHSWNSTLNALRQMRDYWREYKEWHNDPVGVSTRVLARHASSSDRPVEVKVSSISSSEDQSSLDHQYEHATPHHVPLSVFATLPPHRPLSPMGSCQSDSQPEPRPATRSHSQSSLISSRPHTPAWSSKTTIAPCKIRPSTGDSSMGSRPLRPFPRSAYSTDDLSPSQDPSDPLTARRHCTEPIASPQAARVSTVLQLQQSELARK